MKLPLVVSLLASLSCLACVAQVGEVAPATSTVVEFDAGSDAADAGFPSNADPFYGAWYPDAAPATWGGDNVGWVNSGGDR